MVFAYVTTQRINLVYCENRDKTALNFFDEMCNFFSRDLMRILLWIRKDSFAVFLPRKITLHFSLYFLPLIMKRVKIL